MHFYSFWLHFSLLRNLGQEELALKLSMWHETKQTHQDNPPSTNSNKQWSPPSLTSGFDFFFFSCAGMAWITMIPNTYDNVQSWLNSGELDFSFITSALAALQSQRTKAHLPSILRLYVWEELLMPGGQSIAATQLIDTLQMERFGLQPGNWRSNICINRVTIF